MNEPEPELLEPFMIQNPMQGFYKFLFHGYFTENNQEQALEYIREWALQHGWKAVKERRRNIPQNNMFEVMAWLR